MDGLALSTATSTTIARTSLFGNKFLFPSISTRERRTVTGKRRELWLPKRTQFVVLAAKEEPKFDQTDLMELKFGRMIGEDPKLTLAKIMARKADPGVSYLEVEKKFYKNKGKVEEIVELPFNVRRRNTDVKKSNFEDEDEERLVDVWSRKKEVKKPNSVDSLTLLRPVPKDGIKFEKSYGELSSHVGIGKKEVKKSNWVDDFSLVRPVPRDGIKFEDTGKELVSDVRSAKIEVKNSNSLGGLSLVRPASKDGHKFEDEDSKPMVANKPTKPIAEGVDNNNTRHSVPNVILRKPGMLAEGDERSKATVGITPNLTLNMGNDQNKNKDTFSDMTLLRKPEPTSFGNAEAKSSDDSAGTGMKRKEGNPEYGEAMLMKKPDAMKKYMDELSESREEPTGMEREHEDDPTLGKQPLEGTDIEVKPKVDNAVNDQHTELVDSIAKVLEYPPQRKPKRLDQSVRVASTPVKEEIVPMSPDSYRNASEFKDNPSTSSSEDADWRRAEDLLKRGDRVEVELISFSTGGFAVSFGSLIGFLPYRSLTTKWKFLAFESWLRQKGVDPSTYKKQLGVIGIYDTAEKNVSLDSRTDPELDGKNGEEITPDMKLEDLLRIYNQEKLKFLSLFVGQRIKANVIEADRKFRKLIFSARPKEKEEAVERKRTLMSRLRVGDIVECCIKKITYFGIFVEVKGVPALIHQSEVSWDATLDPASSFKVGQILEARVHQLDFTLERIFLSLKEITPDPLLGASGSVTGDDRDPSDASLQAAEADTEWADVESLVNELKQIEGIQSVSKGRFFFSPGLAPTFQVYMASMFENQYKLLARSGNKAQEVIVRASLSKEEMKSTILACANRVE